MSQPEPLTTPRQARARLTHRLFPQGVPRLWCPTLTHFVAQGQLDEPRIRRHLQHLASYVKGALVPGSTGEGWEMSPETVQHLAARYPEFYLFKDTSGKDRVAASKLDFDGVFLVRGAVDTIYLTTFTYGRGLAGRQIPGHTFPDHGAQESDETTFHGGNDATPHPEFYRDTVLKQTRAPDHGDLDIVATVLPAAKKRRMRLFCSIEDVFRSDNNCGGERYANFIRNVGSTVFRDVPKEELLRFNNHLLNYGDEAKRDDLATAELSPDYVLRETQRALAGVQGKCKVFPGIDIGIPTSKNSRKASPDDTYAAVAAALKGGADGLILSRKYSEMQMANLAAAGRAARDAPSG